MKDLIDKALDWLDTLLPKPAPRPIPVRVDDLKASK